MNYNETHIELLQKHYGYTERAARSLWLVAHFSGQSLTQKATRFMRIAKGSPLQTMIDKTIDLFRARAYEIKTNDHGLLRYNLSGKQLYRNLGQPDAAFRRDAGEALNRTRLFALDSSRISTARTS